MLTITELLPQGRHHRRRGPDHRGQPGGLPAICAIATRYFGNVSGGIGWGIAAAVGMQLAQPERKVVALLGDGSAMYSIQALWTAAHQKLPMTFVVFNNGGYRIIKQRLKLFHSTDRFIGMDFYDPPIEFAALARGAWHAGPSGRHAGMRSRPLMPKLSRRSEPTLIEVDRRRQRVADRK